MHACCLAQNHPNYVHSNQIEENVSKASDALWKKTRDNPLLKQTFFNVSNL